MRKFEFQNVRYELRGRGFTGEIDMLYVDGRVIKGYKTIHEFLNVMGEQGWEARPIGIINEHVYCVLLQREKYE